VPKDVVVWLVGEALMSIDSEAFAAFVAEATGVELPASGEGGGGAGGAGGVDAPLWSLRSAVMGHDMQRALEAVRRMDGAFLPAHPLLHARCLHHQCWELTQAGKLEDAMHTLHTAVLPLLTPPPGAAAVDDAVRDVVQHTATAIALGGGWAGRDSSGETVEASRMARLALQSELVDAVMAQHGVPTQGRLALALKRWVADHTSPAQRSSLPAVAAALGPLVRAGFMP